MIEQIKPELVERMVALVRLMQPVWIGGPFHDEIDAIVSELPAPVDPDLLLAREVGGQVDWPSYADKRADYMRGKHDGMASVVAALAAIKRVRQEQANA